MIRHDLMKQSTRSYAWLWLVVRSNDPLYTALRALAHVDYVKIELQTFVALLQDAMVLQQEIDEDTEMNTLFTEMMELASDLLSVLDL